MALLNTPLPMTSFIGRRKELAEVQSSVAVRPLVTLTGMGGCGKTRLALQVAPKLSVGFADGAWLLELAALSDDALLPQLAVKALGVSQAAEKTALELLLDFISSRKMLLVLDNCEHLIHGRAWLAGEILAHSSASRLLATSREPLAIPGEVVYPLTGLAYPRLSWLALPALSSSNNMTHCTPVSAGAALCARIRPHARKPGSRNAHLPPPGWHAPGAGISQRTLQRADPGADSRPPGRPLQPACIPAGGVFAGTA